MLFRSDAASALNKAARYLTHHKSSWPLRLRNFVVQLYTKTVLCIEHISLTLGVIETAADDAEEWIRKPIAGWP